MCEVWGETGGAGHWAATHALSMFKRSFDKYTMGTDE